MNSINPQSEVSISFIKDIQMMMFGLGDSSTPLQSTAAVVEKIVLQQTVLIIGQAEEVAERRGVDGIYPQDILFLMRKDIHKLNRIINYIGFKDIKKSLTSVLNEEDMSGLDVLLPTTLEPRGESKRKVACLQFLHSIGINLNEVNSVDLVRQERLRRGDQRVQNMSQKTYEEYHQSRRATFVNARFGNARFVEWIKQTCPESGAQKLKSFTSDLLLYLAKETVAQLIDIALLLRQDTSVRPNDPFSRTKQVTLPFETYGPSQRQLEGPPPVTPNEVREVLRRFYSMQLCPWGAFTSNLDPSVYNRILAC